MALYKTTENQTVFDICIILYSNLDKLVKLLYDNNLIIGQAIPVGTMISYDGSFTPTNVTYATGFGL